MYNRMWILFLIYLESLFHFKIAKSRSAVFNSQIYFFPHSSILATFCFHTSTLLSRSCVCVCTNGKGEVVIVLRNFACL